MSETITFNLEEKDKQLIEYQAKKSRLSVSSYCRFKMLGDLEDE